MTFLWGYLKNRLHVYYKTKQHTGTENNIHLKVAQLSLENLANVTWQTEKKNGWYCLANGDFHLKDIICKALGKSPKCIIDYSCLNTLGLLVIFVFTNKINQLLSDHKVPTLIFCKHSQIVQVVHYFLTSRIKNVFLTREVSDTKFVVETQSI